MKGLPTLFLRTRNTEVVDVMENAIVKYGKKLCHQRNKAVGAQGTVMLLCAVAIIFLIVTFVGWIDGLKIEDMFSKCLMIVVMMVFFIAFGWMDYRMNLTLQRYRAALARIELLVLKLKLNENENNQTTGWIGRELELITSILEK